MARFIQVKQADGSYRLEPVEEYRQHGSRGPDVFVQADVEGFKSVVDGSIINSRRKMDEHNRRNNVVHESEFGTAKERESFQRRKEAERGDIYNGTTNTHVGRREKRDRVEAIRAAMERHQQ